MFNAIRKAIASKTVKRAKYAATMAKKYTDNLGGYTLAEGLSLGLADAIDAQEWRNACAKRLGVKAAAVDVTSTAVYATLQVLGGFVRMRVA